ncbi:MAG: AAA family ATPase [Candidatus Nanoarchaeia archaeon]|jgi:predicted kinase|nr:AAA family ATPase [Candidatus Nanoarchaeia archaeon]
MDIWFNMLIGIPGSGKSTWLNIQPRKTYVVCPDSIRLYLTGDISNHSQEETVWNIAKYTTRWALVNNISITFDATNTSTFLRRDFLGALPLQVSDFKRKAILFPTDPNVAVSRVNARTFGSKVPPEKIFQSHLLFQQTLKDILDEDWDCIETIGDSNGGKTVKIPESVRT